LQIPFDEMAKQHATTLKSEAYSVSKYANVIWGGDWSIKIFCGQFNQDVIWEIDPSHV